MIKKIFVFVGVSCFLLYGCQSSAETTLEAGVPASTGYASEEVQRISVFYDGSLYLYNATGFELPKEESWQLLGQVASVNNSEWPSEDFCGTHLELGQEIYYNPEEPQNLYVKYDNGFALFEAEETTETEAEYTSSVQARINICSFTSLELELTNVGNETIGYGEAYTLETLQDDSWKPVPALLEEYGFHDIFYGLKPGEHQFLDIEFEWLYGELSPGCYRIVKEMFSSDGETFSVSADFEL